MNKQRSLVVEFFDRNDYAFRSTLTIAVGDDPVLAVHEGVLHVNDVRGTTHYIPLHSVKQYYLQHNAD